jgi:hypothetical protein
MVRTYVSTREMELAVPNLVGLPLTSRRISRSGSSSILTESFSAELICSDRCCGGGFR